MPPRYLSREIERGALARLAHGVAVICAAALALLGAAQLAQADESDATPVAVTAATQPAPAEAEPLAQPATPAAEPEGTLPAPPADEPSIVELPADEPSGDPAQPNQAPPEKPTPDPATEEPTDGEPPVTKPEPPVEPDAPGEPPVLDEPVRPPIAGENEVNGDGEPSETPADPAPPGDPGPGEPQAEPGISTIDETVAGTPEERSAGFARRTGAPVSGGALAAGGVAGVAAALTPAPTAGAGGFARLGAAPGGGDGGVGASGGTEGDVRNDAGGVVTRTVRDIVEVVPNSLKIALAALAALSLLLAAGYILAALRARRLARQRRELLQEVGLLQTALLPPVPERLGALMTSVAYRPADGPGAGGDFYDALPLPGGRVGFILGDVSGHGRGALARTAFMRYTLRAYLEAGLEPRVALQVAGRVIDENLGGDFATVLLAVHDPETGSLTYATAGHPAPIVVGPQEHDPVTASSSPPIGVGERTGLRQTTVPLVPGSVACLFTDGLIEARTEDGTLGRDRLTALLAELGPSASATDLIDRVAGEASKVSDDMAAVVVSPTAGVTAGLFRTEQLELSARELEGSIARRFLESCGLPANEVLAAEREARTLAERFGGAVLHVVFGNRRRVEVLPRNVESIEAASRRAATR